MKTQRRSKTGLLILLALALMPATALAQAGIARGVLYEVLESPPAHAAPGGPTLPGAFPPGIGGRLAQGTEAGSLQGSGSLAFLTGDIVVHAQSQVPVDPVTGTFDIGSIRGVFHVDNGVGVVTAKLDGSLDLSGLTSIPPIPLAPTEGTWATLGKNKTAGTFGGAFQIPFEFVPGSGNWFYVGLDAMTCTPTGLFAPLAANEFGKAGAPLIKLCVILSP